MGALGYSSGQIWLIIVLLALGTFALRFSFLAILGDRTLPPFLLRLLRYTPVAVIPGMVAPLVLWPAATGGEPDPRRLSAAAASLFGGVATRNVFWAILAGAAVLVWGLWLTGQL
jgi:branched-subunit amino acid transport protein